MDHPTVTATDEISAIAALFAAELKDPAKPFTLLVRFRVNDGTQARVEAAFARAGTFTRAETGVITFDVNRETKDPTRFVVYERWKSLADLESHLRTPYIAALRREIDAVIAGAPEFQVLVPAAG